MRRQGVCTICVAVTLSISVFATGLRTWAGAAPREQAQANAVEARKAFVATKKLIAAWWAERDPKSALIPENLRKPDVRRWTPENSAADLWPFLVIGAWFVDRPFFDNECARTLADEQRLTNRLRRLPDDFDLIAHRFVQPKPNLTQIIFGAAEYAKDGLIPISEMLGPKTPYFDRMRELTDDILAESPVKTRFGPIPASDHEVNGDMLQVLSRLWWATRDERYMEMGARIAQHFLLDEPVAKAQRLRLRDHGGEIINGLCEFYVAAKHGRPALAAALRDPLIANLDRILAISTNDDGLLYTEVNAATGEARSKGLADTWGYVLDGYYAIYLVEKIERYRSAVRKALTALEKYREYKWEGESVDGFSDALESAVVLLRWEPVEAALPWCRLTYGKILAIQKPSGIFEGWHGDSPFGAFLWASYLSQGSRIEPWREDVSVGAVPTGNGLLLCLAADKDWQGRLCFDRPRHRDYWNMALDYPRINGFPEWFTAKTGASYGVRIGDAARMRSFRGEDLIRGLDVTVTGGKPLYLTVEQK